MRRPVRILSLLALSLFATASAPTEAARKDFLILTVRGDSGCAQRYTVESNGFRLFTERGREIRQQAGDILHVVGAGTVELTSAEAGKPLTVDAWMLSERDQSPVRYTGQTIKVQRSSFTSPYQVSAR